MRRRNYGAEPPLTHGERYERAEEYMQVVKALWDSWADDAVLDDRARGHLCAIRGVFARSNTPGRTITSRGR